MSVGLTQANITALFRPVGPSIQGNMVSTKPECPVMSLPPLISGVVAAVFDPQAPLIIASVIIIIAGLYFIEHQMGNRG